MSGREASGRATAIPGTVAALCAALVLSGAAALVYQVLWLRLLGLVFGATVIAASTVLASFMAGLALGSALGGRLAEAARRPALAFAAAECVVAACALATPAALGLADSMALALQPLQGATATVLRFVASFLVLAVPTTAMGATFPLLTRSPLARASAVGALYAANTAGAVVGALGAGFVLIGTLGIEASFGVAAALNVGAALTAAALSVFERRQVAPAAAEGGDPASAALPGVRRATLAVFALSGFTSLALEVAWFRLLVLFVPATAYAFTLMLATVLTGLAAGSGLASLLLRTPRDWRRWIVGLQAALAFAVLASIALLSPLPRAVRLLGPIVAALRGEAVLGPALLNEPAPVAAANALLSIFPASLLMGAAFPLGLRLFAERGSGAIAARDVGSFYAANLCGGILGAATAGFVLVPGLGLRGSITLLGALTLAGAVALAFSGTGPTARAWTAAAAAGLAFAAAAARLPDPFEVVVARRYPGDRLLWSEEGTQATVTVHERPGVGRMMFLDGYPQAIDSPAMVGVHRRLAELAADLHPAPRHILVIGLGGGATAGALAALPGSTVDVVELSETVVRAAPLFGHVNGEVLGRPNVRVTIGDGRHHLRTVHGRYDVVTADIVQPYLAGAGALYSVEYFRLVRRALAPGGIAVQWIDHQGSHRYRLIARTFLDAFPDASLWEDGTLLVGGRAVRPEGRAAASYTAGAAGLERFVGEGPLLTDDRPLAEYFLSLPKDDRKVDVAQIRAAEAPARP